MTQNENGVVLVSGCTPRVFSVAMEGETDPYTFMLRSLEQERYAEIAV